MVNDNGSYKYGYRVGPFYRKFLAGENVWCEVNCDGTGGLNMSIGNSDGGSVGSLKFESETHFMEFCVKLMELEALSDWEDIWNRLGHVT